MKTTSRKCALSASFFIIASAIVAAAISLYAAAGAGRYKHATCDERLRRWLHHRSQPQIRLSFLNGPAYRTFGSAAPYLVPDLAPVSSLNRQLPKWISFGLEERLLGKRGLSSNSGFKPNSHDAYLLLRSRLQLNLRPTDWMKVVAQLQGRAALQSESAMGSSQFERVGSETGSYAEFGAIPKNNGCSLRVGLLKPINYNNTTIIANSEWRDQGRSYADAVVANLNYSRYRLGLFAASVVVPLGAQGISHHQEGNNILRRVWRNRPSHPSPTQCWSPSFSGG